MIDFKNKKNITYYIITGLIVLTFTISLVFFIVKGFGTRKTFIFPSAESGKYIVDVRYLRKSNKDLLEYYIDEILLGSGVERTKKLFATGTKIESCFLDGNTLYLNLSNDLLRTELGVINMKEGAELLEKNIKKNFPKVKNIKLFVAGKAAFEN